MANIGFIPNFALPFTMTLPHHAERHPISKFNFLSTSILAPLIYISLTLITALYYSQIWLFSMSALGVVWVDFQLAMRAHEYAKLYSKQRLTELPRSVKLENVALPEDPVEEQKQLPHRCTSPSLTDIRQNNDHDDTETSSLLLVSSGKPPYSGSVISNFPSVDDTEILIKQEQFEILNSEMNSSNKKQCEIVSSFSEPINALGEEEGETECYYEPDWNLSLQIEMDAVKRELEEVISARRDWGFGNLPDATTPSIFVWPAPPESNLSLPLPRPASQPIEEVIEEEENGLAALPESFTKNNEEELELEGLATVPELFTANDHEQDVTVIEELQTVPEPSAAEEDEAELGEEIATVLDPFTADDHKQELEVEKDLLVFLEPSAAEEDEVELGEEIATVPELFTANDHEQEVKVIGEELQTAPEPSAAEEDEVELGEEIATVPDPFTADDHKQELEVEKDLLVLLEPSAAEGDEDLKVISMEELEVYSVSSGSSIRSFGDFVEPSIGVGQSFSSVSSTSAKDTPHFPIIDDVLLAYEASLTSSSNKSYHSTGDKEPEALNNTDDDWDDENDSGLNSPATSVSINSIPNEEVNELDLNKQLPLEAVSPLQSIEIPIPKVIEIQQPPSEEALKIQKRPSLSHKTSLRNFSSHSCSSTTSYSTTSSSSSFCSSSSRSKRPSRKNNGWKRIPKKQRLSPSSKQRFVSRAFW